MPLGIYTVFTVSVHLHWIPWPIFIPCTYVVTSLSSAAEVHGHNQTVLSSSPGLERSQLEIYEEGEQVSKAPLLPVRTQVYAHHKCEVSISRYMLRVIFSNSLRLQLCFRKGIVYVVEQPVSSLLFQYKPVRDSCSYWYCLDIDSCERNMQSWYRSCQQYKCQFWFFTCKHCPVYC